VMDGQVSAQTATGLNFTSLGFQLPDGTFPGQIEFLSLSTAIKPSSPNPIDNLKPSFPDDINPPAGKGVLKWEIRELIKDFQKQRLKILTKIAVGPVSEQAQLLKDLEEIDVNIKGLQNLLDNLDD